MVPRFPGVYPSDDQNPEGEGVSLLDPGDEDDRTIGQHISGRNIVIHSRTKSGERVVIRDPADFARLVQADPNSWFMIISQAQMQAGYSQHYRAARDKAREMAKIASDQCKDKQTVIDDLDGRVADLENQLDRAKEKENELVLAEEAIAAAKKHLESQRTQITELRAKLSEAGQKTPLTEEKRSNRFLDELGLLEPIETENTDEGRKAPGSRAPSAERSVLSADRSVSSHPVLQTCLGERLPSGVGYNSRFPDPNPFSGKKSMYKPWRSGVISKFRESASQYQTAQSGINYIQLKLTDEPWNLVDSFIASNPSCTPGEVLSELDDVYLERNEYVTARAEMETLKQKDDESVEHFMMRFRNINNRMGRTEHDKAVMYDFYSRIRWTVRKHLVAEKDFKTFRELYEAVSLVEQDQKMSKATHPPPIKQRHTTLPTPNSRASPSTPRNSPRSPTTGERPFVKKIENPAERERLRQEGKCLRCRRPNCPGSSDPKSCTAFSEDRPFWNRGRGNAPIRNNAQDVGTDEESATDDASEPLKE
jgi:phosphopantetheine adenylyltransferase